jgi:glycine/D-amino acid oxidase-like deaminating enzyme
MLPVRAGTPLWLDVPDPDRRARDRFPALRGQRTVDIAIVGGGFTGATIAWRFADAGIRIALLEASRVGRGSTAASTALLMQEPDEDFAELVARYGRHHAIRIWELSRNATRDCIVAVSRLGISCGLARRDSVYYALSAPASRRLHHEHRFRSAAGFGGRWLDAAALGRLTGIAGSGGIRVHGNAQLNPWLACRSFIRAAADRGALIFEQSRVTRIRTARDHVTLTTGAGTVRADYVIVATGYATPRFRPLAGRFRLLNTYVAATRRLTDRERRQLGLGSVMLWDTDRPYHYARWTDDARLLIGGGDRPHASGRLRQQALRTGIEAVRDYFRALFPPLGRIALEYGWDGVFAMTPDALPYIGPHRRYPRHLFALGYGGNGMTFGVLAGRLLLDWYTGRDATDLDLFAFSRRRKAATRR